MLLCTNCNSKLETDTKYCPKCGNEVVQSPHLRTLLKVIGQEKQYFELIVNDLKQKLSLLSIFGKEWRKQNGENEKYIRIDGRFVIDGVDIDEPAVKIEKNGYKYRYWLNKNHKMVRKVNGENANKDGKKIGYRDLPNIEKGIEKMINLFNEFEKISQKYHGYLPYDQKPKPLFE